MKKIKKKIMICLTIIKNFYEIQLKEFLLKDNQENFKKGL